MAIDLTNIPSGSSWAYEAVVFGEPASKANSRKIVRFGKRLASIKSDKARRYVDTFRSQAHTIDPLLTGDLLVYIKIYYATRRPDLDESLILDLLQGHAYKNDRQVKTKIILHGLDRDNPRSEIKINEIDVA